MPRAYEFARRVPGHRSIDTTVGLYTGLETLAAVRHFDKTMLDLRKLNGIKLRKGTKGIHANWSRQRK
jgi:hypothetical protein